tara:strand:- start:90 stop:419 length:330 start_codon:yes stop_codon:yes gene_type:complete
MKELKEMEILVKQFNSDAIDFVTTMRDRANQKTFVVKEYYLNCQPPVEQETKIQAVNAVAAIRKIENWKYAESFTHRDCGTFNTEGKLQAHTQDANGMNGCEAIILGET